MKILVTNNTLASLGGSETYAYTLLKELHSRKDILVHGFTPHKGLVAERLVSEGVILVDKPNNDYELILASHNSTTRQIRNFTGTKIQTCHGIYPQLEQPSYDVDKYVSISEEVRLHLEHKKHNSTIIINGVDCERFKPVKKLNPTIKNILSLSQSTELNGTLQKVCDKLGIKLTTLHKFVNPIFNVEDEINNADLVISLGRGVYESMACGRNVLILDKRPYVPKPPLGDGLITNENIDKFILNNCSGRYSNKIYTLQEIEDEIMKYDPKHGDFGREYALENLNIIKQTDKYLNLL